MPRIDLGDFTMFYTDEGSGPPVLLVHGWTCDGSDWSWQIPALRAEHRVLTVDLRGHGRSSVAADGYTPLQFARDIAMLLDRRSTGPVVAVGHSLGGQIVAVLAAERPDLVRAVVPVDAAFGWGPESRPTLTNFASLLTGADTHDVATGLFASAFYPPASPPHLAVLHTRRLLGMEASVIAKTFAGLVDGTGQWSWMERSEELTHRVEVPALTFRGGGDPSSVAAWERTVFTAPGSKAIAWDGSGHFLHQERPAEFNAVLLGWLASLA